MRTRENRRIHVFAALSTALALVVRLVWVFRVQSPYAAVYSDMGEYVARARDLETSSYRIFPRLAAMYPYGAHYVYGATFKLIGYEHETAICIVQALLGTVPAYFFVLFAARFFTRAWMPGVLGLLFALWQPLVWCTGFFLSEVPYIALLFVNTWLCVRFVETKRIGSGFALGLTGAVLFAIRPQFILTFALLALAHLWAVKGQLPRGRALFAYALVVIPWVIVLAFSIGRFHELTGHWGLISENGQLNRLFADTTVGRVEGRWTGPKGETLFYQVTPPCKSRIGETEVVKIDGYMVDPELLAPIRAEHLRDKSFFWRAYRMFDNVRLLWDKNDPWPEQDRARNGFRAFTQRWFNEAARWILIPFACIGVFVLRKRAAVVVVLAHLATLVVLSMFFLAEARYRVPYDPFLMVIASAGAWRAVTIVRQRIKRRSNASLVRSEQV